jgi:hypothetical protein
MDQKIAENLPISCILKFLLYFFRWFGGGGGLAGFWPNFVKLSLEGIVLYCIVRHTRFSRERIHVKDLCQRLYGMNGIFQMQGGKNRFYRNRSMQTGSSGTLIGWKSEPVFVNVYGAQESIPMDRFRQPM